MTYYNSTLAYDELGLNVTKVGLNYTTQAVIAASTIPSWLQWFKPVIDFYAVKSNLAYYFVTPMMIFVYVGSAIVYVIGQMVEFFDFKIQVFRNKRLGLPPPIRKKKKKPNIFERAKKKMVEIEHKREEVKQKKIQEKQAKKEEEVKKLDQLQIKMMDDFDRMKYLNKYYTTFDKHKSMQVKKEQATRHEVQKMWTGSFAKAYASAFLTLNKDLSSVDFREDPPAYSVRDENVMPPSYSRPMTRASSRGGESSPTDITDLWTMAQIARLERKREQQRQKQEWDREGKKTKWRTLAAKSKKPTRKQTHGFTDLDDNFDESEL